MGKWIDKKGVRTSLLVAGIVAIVGIGWAWIAKAEDYHELAAQTAKAQAQSVETQTTMAEAVTYLIGRAKAEDTRKDLMAELCRAGKLEGDDCDPFNLTVPTTEEPPSN